MRYVLCATVMIMLALPAQAAQRKVCGLPVTADAALSPDGKLAAVIRQERTGDPDPEYAKAGALWLRDCRTLKDHKLMPATHLSKNNGDSWIDLGAPVFDLDGRALYVSGVPGADYLTIFRVDLVTDHYAVAFYAELYGIITSGPYRGDILATQHTLLYNGKTDQDGYGDYPFYVFDPQGRVLRYIGGSQTWDDKRLRRWLKGQGWQVSLAGKLPS